MKKCVIMPCLTIYHIRTTTVSITHHSLWILRSITRKTKISMNSQSIRIATICWTAYRVTDTTVSAKIPVSFPLLKDCSNTQNRFLKPRPVRGFGFCERRSSDSKEKQTDFRDEQIKGFLREKGCFTAGQFKKRVRTNALHSKGQFLKFYKNLIKTIQKGTVSV